MAHLAELTKWTRKRFLSDSEAVAERRSCYSEYKSIA